jgi:monofunctional biosynthetic peptidoglycan transglycosylase
VPRERSLLSRFRRLLAWALLGVLLVTVVPVLALRWVPPPASAVMVEAAVENFARGRPTVIRYRWTDWNGIAPSMRLAVVASEDQRFPSHWGFDLRSIAGAVERNETRRRPLGASTITQQVAKNLFLWRGRSYVRKGLEAYFTVLLELCWPKRRILEVYLNVAEFGDGIYGVRAASEAFFKKPPSSLTPPEAALLAAVLPNPRRFRVGNPSGYVQERAHWIEEQMEQLGGPAYLRGL